MTPEELCELIPHAGHMCLISAVVDWDAERIRCRSDSHRSRDNPLRHQGRLHAAHAIEYGAQAAAIHAGLVGRARGCLPEPALLAGASQVELHATRLDDLPGLLEILAKRLLVLGDNVIYAFAVGHRGTELAEGRLVLVRPGVRPGIGVALEPGAEGR
jgi:predicted hotdog family 3-hydroxylacyl-ACP dehydratase